MGDIFKEQLVKREKNLKDDMKKGSIIAVAVTISLLVLLSMDIGAAAVIILVVALIAAYFVHNMNIEYEYSVTNGEIDIDRIYNKTKRKNVFTGNCADFLVMAHIDDKEHLEEYKDLKRYDFSSGGIYGNTYIFVTEYKGKKAQIMIEPNEDILNAMLVTMTPKKLFKNKNV